VLGLGFVLFFFIKDRDWRKLKLIHIPLVLLPYAAGAAGWGVYIMQDPESFRRIFFGSAASGRLSGFAHPLLALQREIVVRYLTPYGLLGQTLAFRLKLLIPAVYAAGALLAWVIGPVRRQKFLQPFLAMWAIACFAVFAIDNQRNGTYLVDLFPHYAVLLAAVLWWFYQFFQSRKEWWGQTTAAAVAVGFVVLQVSGTLFIIVTNPYKHQYQPVVDYVLRHARPSDRIVGSSELGFGIGFDRLHDDLALGYYVHKTPDLVIWNSRYQAWCDAARGTAAGDFVRSRLTEFRKVYETREFEVYIR
jgi:4-amino-4-deoxy-L-arabinose transferase-like glycosyltransferase